MAENNNVIYAHIPMPKLEKVDCNNCENKNTKWCSGCDYKFQSPNNFDFYRPIKNKE